MSRAWTIEGLAALHLLALAGAGLGECAEALGRFKDDCDLALWALLGRTPQQALAALGGEPSPTPSTPTTRPSRPLNRFLQEVGL